MFVSDYWGLTYNSYYYYDYIYPFIVILFTHSLAFSKNSSLKYHMKKHIGEKQFSF